MNKTTCSIDECEKPRKTRGMCGMHAERVRRYGDPNAHGAFIKGDDELRFWSKVDKRAADQCWRWLGTKIGDGYGQIRVGDRRMPAHRYSYELLVGPIPEGLTIDHVWARGCKHKDCVNPAHLEPVTAVENLMRGNSYSAVNARKAHCIRGHEFVRVYVISEGRSRRRCMTCVRLSEQRVRERTRTS